MIKGKNCQGSDYIYLIEVIVVEVLMIDERVWRKEGS